MAFMSTCEILPYLSHTIDQFNMPLYRSQQKEICKELNFMRV